MLNNALIFGGNIDPCYLGDLFSNLPHPLEHAFASNKLQRLTWQACGMEAGWDDNDGFHGAELSSGV
jgi:hypothetical protein